MSTVLKGINYNSEDRDYGKLIAYLYGKSSIQDEILAANYIFSKIFFFQLSISPGKLWDETHITMGRNLSSNHSIHY